MYIYCGIPEVVDRQDILLCQEFSIQNLKKTFSYKQTKSQKLSTTHLVLLT